MVQGSPALQDCALPANALLLVVTCSPGPKGSGALQQHFHLAFQASQQQAFLNQLRADVSPEELHMLRG